MIRKLAQACIHFLRWVDQRFPNLPGHHSRCREIVNTTCTQPWEHNVYGIDYADESAEFTETDYQRIRDHLQECEKAYFLEQTRTAFAEQQLAFPEQHLRLLHQLDPLKYPYMPPPP